MRILVIIPKEWCGKQGLPLLFSLIPQISPANIAPLFMSKFIKISIAAKMLGASLNGVRHMISIHRLVGRKVVQGNREVWEVDIDSVENCKKTYTRRTPTKGVQIRKIRGKYYAPNGYVMIYTPSHPNARCDGYVYEHTLVAEEALGRLLLKGEVVDHINSIRFDNRKENLRVYPDQGTHKRAEYFKPLINRGGDPKVSKLCTGCDKIQPRSHFRPYSHYVDGIELYCQDCRQVAKAEIVKEAQYLYGRREIVGMSFSQISMN